MVPKIYFETTVFNYYFLDDTTRKTNIIATKKMFEEAKKTFIEPYTSGITITELEECSDITKRKKMMQLIEKFDIKIITLENNIECDKLAEKYILAGAIPVAKKGDALHIAMASITGMDILTSWNFAHIVRFKTQQIVRTVNIIEGYNELSINTPMEIIKL